MKTKPKRYAIEIDENLSQHIEIIKQLGGARTTAEAIRQAIASHSFQLLKESKKKILWKNK